MITELTRQLRGQAGRDRWPIPSRLMHNRGIGGVQRDRVQTLGYLRRDGPGGPYEGRSKAPADRKKGRR